MNLASLKKWAPSSEGVTTTSICQLSEPKLVALTGEKENSETNESSLIHILPKRSSSLAILSSVRKSYIETETNGVGEKEEKNLRVIFGCIISVAVFTVLQISNAQGARPKE
jgi:hypothetical protein